MPERVNRDGVRYDSVVDRHLRWGDSTLPPGEVERERRIPGVGLPPKFDYGPEYEESEAESHYDIRGADLPIRAHILRVMFLTDMPTPYKHWIETTWGNGWLVVEEEGWRFWPQEHR